MCLTGIKLVLTSPLDSESKQNLSERRLGDTLRYRNDINDIYSCSWGTITMYENNIGYMSSFVRDAMKISVEKVSL